MSQDYALYVGNLAPGMTQGALHDYFVEKGVPPNSIDMKLNYAFVRVADLDLRDKAIRELHRSQYAGRTMIVEEARGDGSVKQRERDRKSANIVSDTIFIVNYNPSATSEQDLRDLVRQFGNVKAFEMRQAYAWIQFETSDEAQAAVSNLHGSQYQGKSLTVEFSNKDWSRPPGSSNSSYSRGGGGGYGERRGRDDYRSYDRGRSPRRGGSPGRYDERRRSPPRRDERDERDDRHRRDNYSPDRRRERAPSPPGYRAGRDREEPYGRRDDYRGSNMGGGPSSSNSNGAGYGGSRERDDYRRAPPPERRDDREFDDYRRDDYRH